MAKSFDELLDFLISRIALTGQNGTNVAEFQSLVEEFYQPVVEDVAPDINFTAPQPVDSSSPLIDDKLIRKIWQWVVRDPGISLQKRKSSKDGASTSQNKPQGDSVTIMEHDAILLASEDRQWQALAGHGVDYTLIRPLEFSLLSIISAAGSRGISQPELVKKSGQDKRSLPHRTDILANRGYIEKKSYKMKGANTSLCTLKKFVKPAEQKPFNIKDVMTAVPEDLFNYVFPPSAAPVPERLFDVLIQLLKFPAPRKLTWLRERLGTYGHKTQTRVTFTALYRLDLLGVVERVSIPSETGNSNMLQSIKLIRVPDAETRTKFITFTPKDEQRYREEKHQGAGQDTNMLDPELAEDDGETQQQGTEQDSRALRPITQWTPDRPLVNLVFDMFDAAGPEGMSTMEFIDCGGGEFWRRPVDQLLGHLTDVWQESQPPHLRHLAIVRDTDMLEKSLHYRYRTYDNFAKAVQAGDTTWEAVEADAETLKNDQALAKSSTDKWGFQSIPRSQLLLADGSATTTQCRRVFKVERQATSFLDNHVDYMQKQPKSMTPNTRNISGNVSLLDDGKQVQPPTPVVFKRKYTKRVGTPAASSVKYNKRTTLDAQAFLKHVQKQAIRLAQEELGVQHNIASLQSMKSKAKPSTRVDLTTLVHDTGSSSRSIEPDDQPETTRKRVLSEEPDAIPQAKRQRVQGAQVHPFAAQVPERASVIERELLTLSRPGMYIMPPGVRPPAIGRPRNMLIVVVKSGRLQDKDWFLEYSEDVPKIVRDTAPAAKSTPVVRPGDGVRGQEVRLVSDSPMPFVDNSRHDSPLPQASHPHPPMPTAQNLPEIRPASIEDATAIESPTERPAKRQRKLPRRYEPEDPDNDVSMVGTSAAITSSLSKDSPSKRPPPPTVHTDLMAPSRTPDHSIKRSLGRPRREHYVHTLDGLQRLIQPPVAAAQQADTRGIPVSTVVEHADMTPDAVETKAPDMLPASVQSTPVPPTVSAAMSQPTESSKSDGVPRVSTTAPDVTKSPSPDPIQVSPQDAIVQLLARRAAEDPSLKPLMRVIATGKASVEQLTQFRIVTDELKAIVESQARLRKVQEAERPARPTDIEMTTPKHDQAERQVQTTMSQQADLEPPISGSTAEIKAPVSPYFTQDADDLMQDQPPSAILSDAVSAIPDAGPHGSTKTPTAMDEDRTIEQQKPKTPVPEITVLDDQGMSDTGSPQRSRRIQYKQGVRLSAGMIGQKRTQTVMNIVTQAKGAYPADREMFYAYITEWCKYESNVKPDNQTVKRAVKSLVDSGKLIKITFAFADKDGKTTKKHIVILPGMKVNSKVVQDLQKSMVAAYPSLCFPSEVEIDISLLTGVFKDELPSDYVPKMHDGIVHAPERPSPPPRKRRARILSNPAEQRKPEVTYEPAWKKWARDQQVRGVEPAYALDSDDEALAEETSEAQLNMQSELQVDRYSHDAEAMPPKARQGRKLATTHNWLQKAEAARKDKIQKDAIRAAQEQAMKEQQAQRAKLAELRRLAPVPQAKLNATDQPVDYFSSRGSGQQHTTGLQIIQEMADLQYPGREIDIVGQVSEPHDASGSSGRPSPPKALATMTKPMNPYSYIWPFGKSKPGRHPALEYVTTLTDPGQKFHATTGTFGTDFFDIRASRTVPRPKLQLKLDDYSKWEAKIPNSLQDMLKGRRGSNAKSPKSGKTLTYDFDQEINKVANWEKQHEKDLTGRMSLANPRFINHVIPSEVAAQTTWFSKPQDIGRHVRARSSRAVPVQVSRWVPPPSASASPAAPAAMLVPISQWTSPASSAAFPGMAGIQPAPVTQSLPPSSYPAFPGMGVLMPTPASSYPELPDPAATVGYPWPATPVRITPSTTTTLKQPESVSESVESRPITRRGKKPGRRAVAMSSIFKPADVQRLIASVLCVRMLIGGLEQKINWHIVKQLMPDHELPLIKARWAQVESCQFMQLVKLDEQLQEVFITAYEQGRLDNLNYSKLESYDWDTLVVWIIETLNVAADEKLSELPTSRRALDGFDITDNTLSRVSIKDEYYRDLATQMRRTEIVHDISFSVTISKPLPAVHAYIGDALAIARSHVRANNATPAESYNSTAARIKLERLFTEPTLDTAIKSLTTTGIMTRLSKGRVIPGRNYAISDLVFKNLKRHALDLSLLHTAARGKWHLDTALARSGTGRVRMSQLTPDGEVMLLLNLAAAGRVRFEVELPPSTADPAVKPLDAVTGQRHLSVWGFTEGNYKTTQMDRQNIVFEVWVVPTERYVRGVPLPNPLPPPPGPHVRDERHPVPFWYDIHDRLVPSIWEALLAAVLGAITIQPGCSVEDMRNMFRGAVEVWDLELVMEWLCGLGVASGGSGRGYVAEEWWWSVLGGGPEP